MRHQYFQRSHRQLDQLMSIRRGLGLSGTTLSLASRKTAANGRSTGRGSLTWSRWLLLFVSILCFAAWQAAANDQDEATAGAGSESAAGQSTVDLSTADQAESAAPAESEPAETNEELPGEANASAGPVLRLVIDSPIHPVMVQHLASGLQRADELGATALLVELNTPGGLLSSTREMVQAMLGASTPVVVYVSPQGSQAASAGFFLLMAADVAAMAPGTNTGAAHPVGGQGEEIDGAMGEKVTQDAAATIRSLAKQHGRPVELAEEAVVDSRSFSAEEALELGLVDLLATDVAELLSSLDQRALNKSGQELVLATATAPVLEHEMDLFQRILAAVAHPNIAYILMALGWLGLYMELSNPGTLLPGIVGAICLILAFFALSVLPVNYAGVALVLLALVLFIAEVKVVSYGLLTVGGVVSLIFGSFMLFEESAPALRLGTGLVLTTALTVLSIVGILMGRTLLLRRSPVTTGQEGLLGEQGVVRRALASGPAASGEAPYRYKVFLHGELWNALSEQRMQEGQQVAVQEVDGLTLHVRSLGGGAEPPADSGPLATSKMAADATQERAD